MESIKTKHDAIHEFFGEKIKEIAESTLNFNFSAEEMNRISLVTNYSGNIRKKYVRIGAEKEYGFSIIVVKAYSTDEDSLNLEAMNFAQYLSDWIEEQNRQKIYPAFPGNCQIKKMEVLQNMPNLAGINSKERLARYMVQCKIIYFEKENEL